MCAAKLHTLKMRFFNKFLVFYEFSTMDGLFENMPAFIEFEDHFDLLEAMPVTNKHLAADEEGLSFLIKFQAGFIIYIDLPLDGFTTTLAFHGKWVICSCPAGRGEEIFKETHGSLLYM